MLKAKVCEVFKSIEGEGLYVGEPRVFVRFSGCNIKCTYCDTSHKSGEYYSVSTLVSKIKKIGKGCKALSLTGGEPLMYSEFICELLKKLKGYKVYLETNGTLVKDFAHVAQNVSVVSFDYKLVQYTDKDYKDEQVKFLDVLKKNNKDFFVKFVFDKFVDIKKVERAFKCVLKVCSDVPLVLQPVTIKNKVSFDYEKVEVLQDLGLKYFSRVLVIPQMHKFLKIK